MEMSYELQTREQQAPTKIVPQYLDTQNVAPLKVTSIQDEITKKIEIARQESNSLQSQVTKVKDTIQDSNLFEMAANVPVINNKSINLSPTITLRGHNNKIADFRWSNDSKYILSASQDGFLLLWDSETGLKEKAVPLDSQWVLACAISPNGKLISSGGLNNNCTIYSISGESRIQQNIQTIFKGHTCYISDIGFLDNANVVTGSGDMTCALWNIPKARRIREYTDHLGDVLNLSMTPSGSNPNTFCSCGSDGYTYIWDTRTAEATQNFFVSECDVNSVQFFNDGQTIAAGSDNGVIKLLDLRSDCPIASYSLQDSLYPHHSQPTYLPKNNDYNYQLTSPMTSNSMTSYLDDQGVTSLDFSASGRLMYATYTDLGCVVWDLLRAEVVGKLEGHSDRICGVRSSPDGLGVCTGSWDTTLRLWSPK